MLRIAWTSSEERSAAIEAHVRTLEAQVATLIAQTTSLQTRLTTALGRIATLEARDPEPQDGPAEAGSSSIAAALAERDASRSRDGNNSHGSGTGGRRQVPTQRECISLASLVLSKKCLADDKYCPRRDPKAGSEYWKSPSKAESVKGNQASVHARGTLNFATEYDGQKMITAAETSSKRKKRNLKKLQGTPQNQ
ncbi:hypothetical protein Tco_1555131 [Tanacetum coccineum]